MTFAFYLRALRERLGLSQEEIAERLGVTRGHVSHLMTGRSIPAPEAEDYYMSRLPVLKLWPYPLQFEKDQAKERELSFEESLTCAIVRGIFGEERRVK